MSATGHRPRRLAGSALLAIAAALLAVTACDRKTRRALANLESEDQSVRIRALAFLERVESPPLEPIIALLHEDPEVDVRSHAALTLGKLGNREAIPALIEKAASEDEQIVRGFALRSAARMADPEALPALVELMRIERMDADIFPGQVAGEIARNYGSAAFEPFVAALADPDPTMRAYAARGLLNVGDPLALPALEPLLHDPDEWVRYQADWAVRQLSEKRDAAGKEDPR